MAAYKITLSQSNWSNGTAAIWYDSVSHGFYAEQALTTPVTSVAVPTRELYRFNGFYSSSSNGTQYIDADGNFTAALLALTISGAKTFYAQGTQVSYKLTLNDNSGSGGDGALYYRISGGGFYADYLCTGSPVTGVTKPTRANYAFAGYHNGTTTPGTQYIDKDGAFTADLSSLTLTAAKTIYARWVAPYKITVSANSGSGGTTGFYFDSVGGRWYDAQDMANEITAIVPHTRECFAFLGCRASNNDTSDLRISSDGTIASGWAPTAAATIYARWERVSWKITLNKQGGSGGTDAIYGGVSGGKWLDDQCTQRAEHVEVPTRTGYDFAGYWETSSGTGGYEIKTDGTVNMSQSSITTGAYSIYAYWVAHEFTLTLDYNGGTGTPATKTVTFGSAIGTLPSPTNPKGTFLRWSIDGTAITSSTVWNIDADATAKAEYDYIFGKVVDYFSLGGASLVPISSSSGDGKKRTCACNATWSGGSQNGGAGRYSSGVNDIGGVWRNPTVTYQVVGNTTISLNLGKAYAGSGTSLSGYMITSVRVRTQVGKFPTVTVSAVANEGADAINKFAVSIYVQARARAQNLLSAISGGGNLQSCEAAATCTPVVCAENNMPCASDVVQGKYTVKGTTYAPGNESAPTAGTGFTSIGEPKSNGDKEYPMWEITVEKEIT